MPGRRAVFVLGLVVVGACVRSGAAPYPPPRAEPRQPAEPPPIQAGIAPPPGPYAPGFDAVHYGISIALPDTGTDIRGRTVIRVVRKDAARDTLPLDLTGLIVDSVTVDGTAAGYTYAAGKLRVVLPGVGGGAGTAGGSAGARRGVSGTAASRGRGRDTLSVAVSYHGHPDDGLIIRPNVHGERAAFADDWPNRARFWFPSIDHPSDKATVAFTVSAPAPWSVVANGARRDSGGPAPLVPLGGASAGRTVWRWATKVPIPTYTMVIGAADFRIGLVGAACPSAAGRCIPVSWWAFPEDTVAAALSFRRADTMVAVYSRLFGPFQYAKLAHVESSTRFGGMENASAIFYDERALAGGHDIEHTAAHETVHQWFGDAVTEADWHHLWLSEGFATYFAAVFFEQKDGEAEFRRIMAENRAAYLRSDVVNRPVIDTAQHNLFALLNANNYQKGGWVLHMLRGVLGDSAFFRGIRLYYRTHVNGTALTSDLRAAMEQASGRPLGWFFDEWLYHPGYPRLRVAWRWDAGERSVTIDIDQTQPDAWPVFRMPLTLLVHTAAGDVRRQVQMDSRNTTVSVPLRAPPTGVTVDPDGWLLAVIETVPAG